MTLLVAAPRSASADERRGSRDQAASRAEGRRGNEARADSRPAERAVPREVPRSYDRRNVAPPVVVAPRVVRPYVARPYYAAPHYARPYYARPYYAVPYVFRPRTHVAFGIFVGYPVPYAYAYPYPVPVYGYAAPSAPVVVGPNSTQYGGVSLEINPPDASVYVDGGYAGLVRDFDGTRQTLTLALGRHRIEVTAPGFEPWTFDVDVMPGQIVPYQGDLQPIR